MTELYKDFHCPIVVTNPKASEMIKYAANSFLAMKISYMNELARLCDALSINVNEVSKGIGLDTGLVRSSFEPALGMAVPVFRRM